MSDMKKFVLYDKGFSYISVVHPTTTRHPLLLGLLYFSNIDTYDSLDPVIGYRPLVPDSLLLSLILGWGCFPTDSPFWSSLNYYDYLATSQPRVRTFRNNIIDRPTSVVFGGIIDTTTVIASSERPFVDTRYRRRLVNKPLLVKL